MAFSSEEIAQHFLAETSGITDAMVEDGHIERHLRRLQIQERENEAARVRRQAARIERARNWPPCPRCGAEVTRGARVPRGR